MDKAPDAYRTISEVGEDLDIAQHVLRFWETRFPQIKPLKRGGGRRYYRPDDVELLKGIRHLLYREGYTIKGVQRILREQGLKDVMAVGRSGSLAVLATEPEATGWTPGVSQAPELTSPQPIVSAQNLPEPIVFETPSHARTPHPVVSPPSEPAQPRSPILAPIAVSPAPRKSAIAENAMPLLDALLAPQETRPGPESAPSTLTPAQVSMFRGGLQRGQDMPMPTEAVTPSSPSDTIGAERRARLRHALAELEICKAILAEHQRRAG